MAKSFAGAVRGMVRPRQSSFLTMAQNPTLVTGLRLNFDYRLVVKWNTQTVYKRVRNTQKRELYRTAGFIRTLTKRAQRKRPGPSTPGQPPHAHRRLGLRVIKFKVLDDNNAIIGPVKFPRSKFWSRPVPRMHERGGSYYNLLSARVARYPERSMMYKPVRKQQHRIARQFKFTLT